MNTGGDAAGSERKLLKPVGGESRHPETGTTAIREGTKATTAASSGVCDAPAPQLPAGIPAGIGNSDGKTDGDCACGGVLLFHVLGSDGRMCSRCGDIVLPVLPSESIPSKTAANGPRSRSVSDPTPDRSLGENAAPGTSATCLTLPLPPSVNHYWRSIVWKGRVKVLLSKEGRAYKKACKDAALAQRCRFHAGDVRLSATVYFENRRRDLDGAAKALLDALQGGIAYKNDRQVRELHLKAAVDKARPRVELTIEAVHDYGRHE